MQRLNEGECWQGSSEWWQSQETALQNRRELHSKAARALHRSAASRLQCSWWWAGKGCPQLTAKSSLSAEFVFPRWRRNTLSCSSSGKRGGAWLGDALAATTCATHGAVSISDLAGEKQTASWW